MTATDRTSTTVLAFADHRLRPMQAADSGRILAWRNADRIRARMFSDHVIGEAEHARWFTAALCDPTAAYRLYEHKGRPIGFVSFTGIDRHNRRCAWGFYLGDEDAPPGSGSAMGLLALDDAFGPLSMGKLCCEVFAFNGPAIRFLKRLGFCEEGRLVRHALKDGALQDVVLLARFGDPWPEDRPALMSSVFQEA